MTAAQNNFGKLLARVLLSFIFLFSAYTKFRDIPETVAYMQAAGLGGATLLAWLTGFIELLGGLMILFGLYVSRVALILALYLVPVTYFFHFDLQEGTQTFHFLKNLAIMGGLISLTVSGGGEYALKNDFVPMEATVKTIKKGKRK